MEHNYELRSKGRKTYRNNESLDKSQNSQADSQASEEDESYRSYEEDSVNSDGSIVHDDHKNKSSPAEANNTKQIFMCVILLIISTLAGLYFIEGQEEISMENLKSKYNTQTKEIWQSLETGVMEVKDFNKPSVFIYLYDKQSEEFIDTFVTNIAEYASKVLNAGNVIPAIYLTSDDLNTTEAIKDYGIILDKYKNDLQTKSIMVVKNIDKIPGKVAQALHSFCDEYTPLVAKSMFIFTIKTKDTSLSQSEYKLVDSILRENWKELDQDIYAPLFARISSMILRIHN